MKPTEKQISYAVDIARLLEIPLPEEDSKQAYSDFISKHVDEYNRCRYSFDDDDFADIYGMGLWDIGL